MALSSRCGFFLLGIDPRLARGENLVFKKSFARTETARNHEEGEDHEQEPICGEFIR